MDSHHIHGYGRNASILTRLFRHVTGAVIALGASTISPSVHATTVSYTGLCTFATPALNTGGILVTGPANVNIDPSAGVGIVGGALNLWVDGTEFVDFTRPTRGERDLQSSSDRRQ